MMRVLLLLRLGACFCVGFSYDRRLDYGDTYRMRIPRKTQSIVFHPNDSSNVTILWSSDDPPAAEDSRRKVMGSYFIIYKLTQEDSGSYVMRDKDKRTLSTTTIDVEEISRFYERSTGESLRITFDLEPNSCNIYFFPEYDDRRETEIVRHGRLQEYSYNSDCTGFEVLNPCGILNQDLQMSCRGKFEVRDPKGNKALVVSLGMEQREVPEKDFDTSSIGIGIGVFLAVISCCSCLRRCCCGKSSSNKDTSETPDAEPAVQYHEYDSEPAGPRPEHLSEPSGTQYPAQSSCTPTGPLIHNPPTPVPPPYSEIMAAEQSDAPTVPVYSEAEPRFEMKGMTFPSAPLLSSDSSHCDVYNSDKLNFL